MEMGKGKIIKKNVVKRKPKKGYYVDGEGNLCEIDFKGGRNKKKK